VDVIARNDEITLKKDMEIRMIRILEGRNNDMFSYKNGQHLLAFNRLIQHKLSIISPHKKALKFLIK
jgi:hypothetical protein